MLSLHSSRPAASSSKTPQEIASDKAVVKADDVKARNEPQGHHEQLEKLQIEFSRLQEALERESKEREKFERKVEHLEKFCISRGYDPTTEYNEKRTVSNEDERQLVLHRPPTPHSPSQDSPSSKDSPQHSKHTTQSPSVPIFRFGEGNEAVFTGVKIQDHKFEFGTNQFKREGLKRRHHEMSPPAEGYAFAFDDDLPRKSLRRQ